MARFDLNALLAEESATRPPVMLRPPTPGNPVMEQMQSGFQITPEELAFKAQGDPDRARRKGFLSFLAGGPTRGMAAHRASMEQSKAEQTQKMLSGAYGRLIGTEGRTRQDLNEMALYRAHLTGEQPRTYAPPNIQTTLRERPYTKGGVGYFQREFVGIDPDTGQVVGEAQPYGDPIRQRPRKTRAPLTYEQEAQYKNKLDTRAMISMGGWDDQILDIIKAIDPDQTLDVNDPQAAMKALLGGKGSDKLPNYVLDYLDELTSAYDAVAGDEAYGDPKQRRRAKIALSDRVFDIWRQHKYGDPEQGVTTGTGMTGEEMDERLAGLGAGPAGATTQDPSLLSQARAAFGGGGDPYARQPAYTPPVPSFRPEQFAGPGVSGIVPPMTIDTAPTSVGPPSRALRAAQAPERLQPLTTPRVSGAPFDPLAEVRSLGEPYRRRKKQFKRGDKERRELSPLERTLAQIVNGESAVR